jgi:uncharacterized protein (DUF342 family)
MEQINSYFQVEVRNEGVFLKIFPPKEQGTTLTVSEVTTYLNSQNLTSFDLKELNAAIQSRQLVAVRVGENTGIPINETMIIKISADNMMVVCSFYPASDKGSKMDAQEIVKDLQFRGIRFGIKQEEIINFLTNRLYCTEYVLAEGKPPVHGKDANIQYFFNTDLNLKPKKNEDGSVDYHELATISHVKQGDLLAKLEMEDLGTSGKDVLGQEIKPRTVKTMRLSYANNITLSEDQTEIRSNVTGHASIVDGKVFVSDIYEVPADVDNSVGNINYQGNIHIAGNVKSGFQIYAKGDIIVEGVVEDAVLQSESQIIVKRGIHGMNRGVLKASGNVICKFIENATVIAGGYVETESIILSQVSAASEVRVAGLKGFITGGVIRAGGVVEALTIGSEMGAPTRIEVGVEPEKKERYISLQKMIQQTNKEIAQIKPVLTSYSEKLARGEQIAKDKLRYVQQLVYTLQEKQKAVSEAETEYLQLHAEMMRGNSAKVKVKNAIYPGVTVSISDLSINMYEKRNFCQLIKQQGEIVIQNL